MDWEAIWWCVVDGLCLMGYLITILPINWNCFKKEDPYKYCPKEEE